MLFQHGRTNHCWVDGSPYAFQFWKQSAVSTMDTETYIVTNDGGRLYHTSPIQRQNTSLQCIDYIEPVADTTVNCTAAIITPESIIKWTKVPCTKEHDKAAFICEMSDSSYQVISSQGIQGRVRSYTECPPRAIHLTNRCIRVYTSIWTNLHDINNICMVKNATLYQIPKFVVLDDPLLYSEREIFLVSFLQAMNHRWPGLADYESALIDDLIMANMTSMEPVVFRFALTTISHIEVDYQHSRKNGTGSVHVVCEFPLSPVSSDCLGGHFSCDDGTCILEHYVCDGVMDCPDSTDEYDCDHVCTFADENDVFASTDCFLSCFSSNCTCSDLYFHCSLGGCIPWSRLCNGVNDCPNNEDEQVCKFYYLDRTSLIMYIAQKSDTLHFADDTGTFMKTFNCGIGSSIPLILKHDLVPDCLDQSDEDEYHDFLARGSKTTYSTNVSLCNGPGDTTCVKNFPEVCYPRHLYCIYEVHQSGTVGCRNGGHLSNCQYHSCPSQFKCPDAYCVPVHTICDGKQDCPDGEDERNCQSVSCPGFLLCRHDNICVHPYDVWSGHVKCPMSMDDKALRNLPKCPLLCFCLGYAMSCKSASAGDLPRLPAALRFLVLDRIHIDINKINFMEGITFLLLLQVTNANLDQLQGEDLSSLLFLKNLNMSYNNITTLGPQTFSTLANLEKMDLSHNLLETLHPDIFTGLRLLRQLNLNHNNIQLVSDCTFQNLQELEMLKLSHNKLTQLGKNVLCGLGLKELDVSYNSLSIIDANILIYSFQHLRTLNTIPKRICCFVPIELNCYPKVKLSTFSSCSRLFHSLALRNILWFAGSILSSLVFPSVTWLIYQIRVKAYNKCLYKVLLLLLFASNLYVCIYVFTILYIDYFSARYYSFFDDPWRHHAVCSLLHTLSYAFFQTTPFVCLLMSSVRAIGTIYPFKAQDISMWALLVSIFLWFVVSICLGYSGIAWVFPEYKTLPDSALGLGLLLPGLGREKGYVALHTLVFIIPNATILLFFCVLQAIIIHGLNNKTVISHSSQRRQNKAIRISIIALLLFILQYCPLVVVHILIMFSVFLKANVEIIVTSWTLVFIPAGNILLYICFSSDFQSQFLRICSPVLQIVNRYSRDP